MASLICVAASTRPPNVLISKIIADAPFASASLIDLSIYGVVPNQLSPRLKFYKSDWKKKR